MAVEPLVAPAPYTGIIDLFHGDQDVLATEAAADGVLFAFLKIGTGVGCPDSAFGARFAEAIRLGIYPGGYHFITGQHSGAEQWADCKRLWDAVCATNGVDPKKYPLATDHERNPSGQPATPAIAIAFCQAAAADGYRVGIYCGLDQGARDFPVGSAAAAYWLAAYGPNPLTESVPGAWRDTDWTLAQYTNGGAGPADQTMFPRSHCDRSCWRGDAASLRAWWTSDGTP